MQTLGSKHKGTPGIYCKRFHHGCTKISRHQRNDMHFIEEWKCGNCNGSPDPPETDDKPRPSTCAHRKTTIRLNANRTHCNKCNQEAWGATSTKNKCNQNSSSPENAKNALTKSIKEPQEQLAAAVTKLINLPASRGKADKLMGTKEGNVTNATKKKLGKSSPRIVTK